MNVIPVTLDVDNIIQQKAPRHYSKIPKLVIRYLKRIIHQDEINYILYTYRDYDGIDFMQELIKYFNIKIEVKGEENFDLNGRYIFASNHPLGGLDGICLSALIGSRFDKKIKYLVNDILLNIKPLESIFIPINKHGRQARESAKMINEAYESENQIVTFPSGLCSRKQNGKIEDLPWQKSFITKAVESKRDIIPVHFEGKNSNFFYNLALIRKKLGIKFNIEMLYLADELFKSRNSNFKVTFGEPIKWESLDKSKTAQKWAEYCKEKSYALK